MGRRRLLPNINSLLLKLHLPHPHTSNEKEQKDSSTEEDASENENNNNPQHHNHNHNHSSSHPADQHHNLHIFTWPSLKRRLSSSSLESKSSEDDDHETEPPNSHGSLGDLSSCHVKSRSHKTVVSFGTCEVRAYQQVLGDHPCCSEGCPVQLGWSYICEESIKVDDYEREYHTEYISGDGNDECDLISLPKTTNLHELRLTSEERRSILICSKQQDYVNAHAAESCDSDGSGESDLGKSSLEDSACNSCTSALHHHSEHQQSPPSPDHDRELMRECRRLNRIGGWNVNVKASRKRNKRNQEAFFGSPIPKTSTSTDCTSPTAPESTIETPAEVDTANRTATTINNTTHTPLAR